MERVRILVVEQDGLGLLPKLRELQLHERVVISVLSVTGVTGVAGGGGKAMYNGKQGGTDTKMRRRGVKHRTPSLVFAPSPFLLDNAQGRSGNRRVGMHLSFLQTYKNDVLDRRVFYREASLRSTGL